MPPTLPSTRAGPASAWEAVAPRWPASAEIKCARAAPRVLTLVRRPARAVGQPATPAAAAAAALCAHASGCACVACVAVRGLPQQAALLSLGQLSSAAGATAAPGSMRPLLCRLPIMLAARSNSSLPFPTPCSACRALAWLAGQGRCLWQLHRAELRTRRLWAPRLHRLPREFPLQAGLWHLLRLCGLEPQLLKEMMHGQNTQICAW